MTDSANWSFETRQIHAGQAPDPATGARALPIYQTTSFVFPDAAHAADRFALADLGPIYTRIGNPTQEAVEERIASLEGGVGALLVASGQAAETLAILNLAEAGDHVVASPRLYGGTYNLLSTPCPSSASTPPSSTDPRRPAAWRDAVQPNTKLFFAETIANPRARLPRHPDGRRRRARRRRAADRRQHRRHAVPGPAAGARRRHRRALRHQVPRRPRHRDRRRDRRRRQLRLRRRTRERFPASTTPTPATTAWSTPATSASAARSGRTCVHPQGARAAAARPRLGHLAVQRLPDRARASRRSRCAWSATSPTPSGSREWLEARDEVATVHYAGPAVEPLLRAGRQYAPEGRRRRAGVRARRAAPRPGKAFVSALRAALARGEHRRRALAGDPPGLHHAQPAHPRGAGASGVTPGLVRLAVGIEDIEDILADLDAGSGPPRA